MAGATALALTVTTIGAAPSASAADPHREVGLYGTTDPTYDGVYRQSLAILGLHAAGTAPAPEAVVWLERQQCADGGFSSYNPDTSKPCPAFDPATYTGGEDTNATALAVQALLAVGRTPAATKAATWLTTLQNSDGGWEYTADPAGGDSDPNSTALVLTALTAAGVRAEDAPRSGVDYLAGVQVGRGDFDGTDPDDRGGLATPWQPTTPDVLATVQAIPALTGGDLLDLAPTGVPWKDAVAAAPDEEPPATAAATATWATTWLGAQVSDDQVTASNAPWAVLSFAANRRGENLAYDLYADQIAGKVPAANPGANAQAALAAAVLGKRADLASYATRIAATLQRDTQRPTAAVVVPKAPKHARSWKRLDVRATDAGMGVATVAVAVAQKRAGTWYAYNGTRWKKADSGKARSWLPARATTGDLWRVKVTGLTTGKLVVRAQATDAAGRQSAVHKVTQQLTKKK